MAAAAYQDLDLAFKLANELLSEQRFRITLSYHIEKEDKKYPVRVEMKLSSGVVKRLGILFLVRLEGKDWDAQPFEKLARSTGQLFLVLLEKVKIIKIAAENRERYYISPIGTIFEFNGYASLAEDGILFVQRKPVLYDKKPVRIDQIEGEGLITFIDPLISSRPGCIELNYPADTRENKGTFINEKNELFSV